MLETWYAFNNRIYKIVTLHTPSSIEHFALSQTYSQGANKRLLTFFLQILFDFLSKTIKITEFGFVPAMI